MRNGERSKACRPQNDAVMLLCMQEARCGVVNGTDSHSDTRQGDSLLQGLSQQQLPAAQADGSWHRSKPKG